MKPAQYRTPWGPVQGRIWGCVESEKGPSEVRHKDFEFFSKLVFFEVKLSSATSIFVPWMGVGDDFLC